MSAIMATRRILVPLLLVLLLPDGDRVTTAEGKEVTMHGRQEADRCVCTFVSPYLPADFPQPPPQQSRRQDCTDSVLDSEFIKQELHFMRRHQIANRKQRVDAMFEEMLQMRELNQRLMFELQDQSDRSEEYRTKLDTLTKRVENVDLNMNEFMFAFAGMKRMVAPGETLPNLAEEPIEEPAVKKEPPAQGSGDITFDDVDYDIVPNPRRRRETNKS
ncbi:PREDICTED: uncharacterized protein LOC109487281 [Branchiostoma belcheri]|uniref:Uncharacterized protein LOC109487281 n=1 Tax=Branchiostoma belcheri TaxID=7741 RepID=A0A6P5AUR6_BRABE|nr:PREDICTED: uncharacterized protein LOC109487281 [Branchiostoma belcheri]